MHLYYGDDKARGNQKWKAKGCSGRSTRVKRLPDLTDNWRPLRHKYLPERSGLAAQDEPISLSLLILIELVQILHPFNPRLLRDHGPGKRQA